MYSVPCWGLQIHVHTQTSFPALGEAPEGGIWHEYLPAGTNPDDLPHSHPPNRVSSHCPLSQLLILILNTICYKSGHMITIWKFSDCLMPSCEGLMFNDYCTYTQLALLFASHSSPSYLSVSDKHKFVDILFECLEYSYIVTSGWIRLLCAFSAVGCVNKFLYCSIC